MATIKGTYETKLCGANAFFIPNIPKLVTTQAPNGDAFNPCDGKLI